MLHPRIIPCLLIKNGGLVKTSKFTDPKYVGDPINAVRIFNEKEVDELIVLDIDATALNREPNYELIANLAAECRMPLCYGGGVSKVEQVERIIGLGVEKVALGAAAVMSPRLISEAAMRVGNQSIVVVIDVRSVGLSNTYEIFTHNGTYASGLEPAEFSSKLASLGAGEIVVNSIERDGTMSGYDIDLLSRIRAATSLPLTALGGCGSIKDIEVLIRRFDIVGAAAGSLFVFKGKYKAVLINYLNQIDKEVLLRKVGKL